METQNLWPDFAVEPIRSPKAILKEQAGFLMEKTNNVLSAEVETMLFPDKRITHEFYIVAPSINNYRYRILSVSHNAFFYPLTISWSNGGSEINSEEEFVQYLSQVFNAGETVRVISSLLAQSMAE